MPCRDYCLRSCLFLPNPPFHTHTHTHTRRLQWEEEEGKEKGRVKEAKEERQIWALSIHADTQAHTGTQTHSDTQTAMYTHLMQQSFLHSLKV
mmetsp:Transcript_93159/g.136086  ORF Transcript_93159/g.136086 Transcript_93159/m.136086 type:complete len:93 (+) Transcript_93159:252-530(+)